MLISDAIKAKLPEGVPFPAGLVGDAVEEAPAEEAPAEEAAADKEKPKSYWSTHPILLLPSTDSGVMESGIILEAF